MARRIRLAIMAAWLPLVGLGCGGDPEDTGPIAFENLRIEEISPYRAVIRFDTSREATCEVRFGLTAGALDGVATDPNMAPGAYSIEHEVPLEDLVPETTYYFAAVAKGRDGIEYLSDPGELTTLAGSSVDAMTNVAALASGTQVSAVSSNYGGSANDGLFGANSAIDGMMSSDWSSAGDGDDAFIEIDFGETRSFEVVGFRSRFMSDGTSIIQRFELVLDGATELGPFDSPDPDVRYLFALDEAVTARRVRMNALETTGGNTGVKELELYTP